MSDLKEDDLVQYYQDTLEQGIAFMCEAVNVSTERYDRDKADGECYLDCFRDMAKLLTKSGFKFDEELADFVLQKDSFSNAKGIVISVTYFKKSLRHIADNICTYSPQELARTLARLAESAHHETAINYLNKKDLQRGGF